MRYVMINAMFAAIKKLDQGGKSIQRDQLMSFFSATHAETEGNAIHFRVIGSGNGDYGFSRQRVRIDIAKPEIAQGGPVPENQAPVNGIGTDF